MPTLLEDFPASFLLDMTLKSTLLCLVAFGAARLLRKSAASSRHLVWLLLMGGLCALPLLALGLPRWQAFVWEKDVPVQTTTEAGTVEAATTVMATPVPASPETPVCDPSTPLPTSAPPSAAAVIIVNRSADGAPYATGQVEMPEPPPAPPAVGMVEIASDPPAASAFPLWAAALVGVWLVGFLIAAISLLTSLLAMRRIERDSRLVTSGPLYGVAGEISRTLGLRRKVTLLQAQVLSPVFAPMTWGYRRPVVLLPANGFHPLWWLSLILGAASKVFLFMHRVLDVATSRILRDRTSGV